MSNMSATQRGAVIFGIMLVALVLCAWLTFSVLPSAGIAVALPVITVPGESFNGALPSASNYGVGNPVSGWTNTFIAMLLSDAAVLGFVILARRATRNFTRQVPNRFGAWVELVGNFMYGQTKAFAGDRPLALNWLFPLAATIFVFLLAANWMKLLPGIESVGVLHCAHEGFSGYPAREVGPGYQLYVDQPLYAGVRATSEDFEACEHFMSTQPSWPTAEELNVAADNLTVAEAQTVASFNEEPNLTQAEKDARIEEVRLQAAEEVYHGARFSLTADEIRQGIRPFVMVITPFVRGASTDLNLTLGLALVSVFAIQVFGVAAQGPTYFQKFINLNALGNLSKKPLGAIDFIVGLFEIVSEIGKIISLAFRLFGNMFGGGILLAVMSFLIAGLLPVVFLGLELIVTSIQAFVFAVLTIVFAAQAMEGHHGDDEHHDEAHPETPDNPEHLEAHGNQAGVPVAPTANS